MTLIFPNPWPQREWTNTSLAKTFATILATMWTVAKMLHSDRLASGLQVESKTNFENGDL